jgi:hypothetical protein
MHAAAFRTIRDAKVVFVPIGEYVNKKGELKTKFARTGIRVEMEDGSWWFYHFRYNTWSRHYPGMVIVEQGFNAMPTCCERKDGGLAPHALKRVWGHNPQLLAALEEGKELALIREAEEREERRAA